MKKILVFIQIIFLNNLAFSQSQILKKRNHLKIDTEIGYQFNKLLIYSPGHYKTINDWLLIRNSIFTRFGVSFVNNRLTPKLSISNDRFTFYEKSITAPVTYSYTKSDFIRLTSAVEKGVLKKYTLFLGTNFDLLFNRKTILKSENRINKTSKPIFESIYYSSKIQNFVFGLGLGAKYQLNQWGIQFTQNIPLTPSTKYQIKKDGTGIPRNNLNFKYFSSRIGIVYQFDTK